MSHEGESDRFDELRLDEKLACQLFTQVCFALDYLHKLKIVHRDLKPENILLKKVARTNSSGKIEEVPQIKLIDFGLGNLYSDRAKLNTPCGSPSYAPPEMILNKDYDPEKTDFYSAGITLYIILTGEPPYTGEKLEDLYQEILNKELEFPSWLSKNACVVLEGFLHRDPEKRWNWAQYKNSKWAKSHISDISSMDNQVVMEQNRLRGQSENLYPELVQEVLG